MTPQEAIHRIKTHTEIHSRKEPNAVYITEALQMAVDALAKMQWISVKERLPENDYGKHWKERKYYIVRLQGDRIRIARYGYKEYEWWVDSHDCVLSKDHYTEVTHWMEAPQPPKGE